MTEHLTRVIRSVTNLWDEPLDEVHDVPPIVNAILAAGFSHASERPASVQVLDCNAADLHRDPHVWDFGSGEHFVCFGAIEPTEPETDQPKEY